MPPAATQAQLRGLFARRGLPRRIRVDNGAPWGSAGDLPTDPAPWLIGLGIEVIWDPPRRPQDNGVIERPQGTGKRWAEPATCGAAAELQRRIDEMDRIQREAYPAVAGLSRSAAHPRPAHSGRPDDPAAEASRWDAARVAGHRAGYVAARRVDGSGTVSLSNRNRYVGTGLGGRVVSVSLDPIDLEWVFAGRDGTCYRRQKAEELTAGRVVGLDVTHRHDRRQPIRPMPMSDFPAQPQVG